MTMKIIWWVVTLLLCAFLSFAAFNHIRMAPEIVEGTKHVGFPGGMMPFMGVLKLLAVLTILFVPVYDLKVAAYAGVFFYGVGAIALHVAAGDPFQNSLGGVGIAVLSLLSFVLWKRLRTTSAMPRLQTA